MWQHIFALPLVAKIIGLLGVAALGVWGWAKHKAIAEVTGAATNAIDSRLFGWFGKKLHAHLPPPSESQTSPRDERTYRGLFQGFHQYANHPNEWAVTLVDESGTTIKVPLFRTNLLTGVQYGDVVEIDTLSGANYFAEIVQRVRIVKHRV
jgi:hypothetical protein